MRAVSYEADDQVRHVFAARRAERIRRQAIDLAHDYTVNARRLRLDPPIVALDVAAIVNAWQTVTTPGAANGTDTTHEP